MYAFTPWLIEIECSLYHGCELLTPTVKSREIYYQPNAKFE